MVLPIIAMTCDFDFDAGVPFFPLRVGTVTLLVIWTAGTLRELNESGIERRVRGSNDDVPEN